MKKGVSTVFLLYVSIAISLLVAVIFFNLNQNIFKFFLKNYDEKRVRTSIFLIKDVSMKVYSKNYTTINFTIIPLVNNIKLNNWIIEFSDAYDLKISYCKVLAFTTNPYETRYIKVYVKTPSFSAVSSNQKLTFSYIPTGDPAEVTVELNRTCTDFLFKFLQKQNALRLNVGIEGIFIGSVIKCFKDQYTRTIVCLER